jgi:hypothetical protein
MDLFAGIPVRDHDAAVPWYERLLGGPPAFVAHPTESVWELADHRFVYVEEDPGRAGHALVTVFVDDLDATVGAITGRGLEPANRETYANGVRKVTYRDADGTEVGFGGAPRESPREATRDAPPEAQGDGGYGAGR